MDDRGGQCCVNCGETSGDFEIDYSNGFIICRSCGTVQPEQVIDEGKEWREFLTEDGGGGGNQRNRAEKVDEEFHSLGTEISTTNFGSKALSATAKSLAKYSKIATSSEASRSEHNLKEAYARINELCEQLQLNDLIKQDAKNVMRDFEGRKNKNSKGYKKDAFIVAVLLLACKHNHCARTLKNMARLTNIDEKDIKKFYKILLRDPLLAQVKSDQRVLKETEELVEVFCSKLYQPYSISKEAKEVASKSVGVLEGKKPASMAAASILYVMKRNGFQERQSDIAKIAGVSANTLRNVFNELRNRADIQGSNYYEAPSG